MKSKIFTSFDIILFLIIILTIYLLYFNINLSSYKINKIVKSTPNYVDIDELIYEDKNINDIINQVNKSLNSTISNKGELIVRHSIDMGVDPYISTAIILYETGCKWECSYLVNYCNNVGGQKGSGCNGYSYFNTIDEGIIAFIDNLANNYVYQGLTTLEAINKKYAENPNWAYNVQKYIDDIKAQ